MTKQRPEQIRTETQAPDSGPAQPPDLDPLGAQQNKFDQRFHELTDGFGALCEQQQIGLALALLVDPQRPEGPPVVFLRGNTYEVAKLLNRVLHSLRLEIMESIT